MNASLSSGERYTNGFTNGWIHSFKRRNGLKAYKSHGESGDADHDAAVSALPDIRRLVSEFSPNDVFNADEFGLYYSNAPRSTIGPARLMGKKKSKDRVTVLLCSNMNGTDKVNPLIVGRSRNPRCFGGRSGTELGFDYDYSGKAWMTSEIFFGWLERFDAFIGITAGRKALLLLDNASCHGRIDHLPLLHNVKVFFLPKCTTSILQPLDLGIIGSVKKRYQLKMSQRAVDIIDSGGIDQLYKVDIKQACVWMNEIWEQTSTEVIYNCWMKSGLVNNTE